MNATSIPWIYRRWPAVWGILTVAAVVALWLAFGEDLFSTTDNHCDLPDPAGGTNSRVRVH